MAKSAEAVRERKAAKRRKKVNRMLNFDYTLLFLTIFLLAFGLVMIYSTTAYGSALKNDGNSLYYLKKQVVSASIGFFFLLVFAWTDYNIWKPFIPIFYIGTFIANIAVLFIGTSSNGSSRWFRIAGFSIQPSEFAKAAIITSAALIIAARPKAQRQMANTIKSLAVLSLPLAGPVAAENLTTGFIIVAIAIVMFFVVSPKFKDFIVVGAVVFMLGVMYIAFAGYRGARIQAWLHPEDFTDSQGFQTLQALYAIGSGGLFGKGLGESMQKTIVPEAQNDMIFSIICEEMGVIGAVCLILLYILLLYRLVFIACHARDVFGSYICIGIMAHYAVQVVLNIAVVTNSMPNTGVTLPLISYGGSAVIVLLAEIGLALSVSKYMIFEDKDNN